MSKKVPKLKHYFVQYAWASFPGEGDTSMLSVVAAKDEKDSIKLFCEKMGVIYQSAWMPILSTEINKKYKVNIQIITRTLQEFFSEQEAAWILTGLQDGACDFKFERSINYG